MKYIVAIVNQISSGLLNFGYNIFLLKILTVAEFGSYGLGFAAVLFVSGVANAVFITNFVINFGGKVEKEKIEYTLTFLLLIALFSLFIIFFGWAISQIAREFWLGKANFFVATGFCAAGYILKDFFIRYSYSVGEEASGVVVNFVSLFVVIFLSTMVILYNVTIDSTAALIILAGGFFSGVGVALLIFKIDYLVFSIKSFNLELKNLWSNGKWPLFGGLIIWGQSQSYVYVIGVFSGTEGVGLANAAKVLISPAQFVIQAVSQIYLPQFSRNKNKEHWIQKTEINLLSVKLIGLVLLYFILLFLVYYFTNFDFIKNRADGFLICAVAWAMYMFFQYSRIVSSLKLQVLKEFKKISILNFWAAVFSLAMGGWLIQSYGPAGVIFGMVFGEFAISVLFYKEIMKKLNVH